MTTATLEILNPLLGIEEGDVFTIHFKENSIPDISFIVAIINKHKIANSLDAISSSIIEESDWFTAAKNFLRLTVSCNWNSESLNIFSGQISKDIEKIRVISRKRHAVDIHSLKSDYILFEFNSNSIDGVDELLFLHQIDSLRLGSQDEKILEDVLRKRSWGNATPLGSFRNMLSGEQLDHFTSKVMPNLLLLRAIA